MTSRGRRIAGLAGLCLALGATTAAQATGAGGGAASVAVGWWSHETDAAYSDIYVAGGRDSGGVAPRGFVDSIHVACDGDDLVFRAVWNETISYREEPLGPVSMATTGPFEGFELRAPGCHDPAFDDASERELTGLALTASATLTPQGDPAPVTRSGAETFGLCAFAFGEAGIVRAASGTLAASGAYGFDAAALKTFEGATFAGAGAGAEFDEAGCTPAPRPSLRDARSAAERRAAARALVTAVRR